MKSLISVFDKRDVDELAKNLEKLGIEIIATEGTAKKISEGGVIVKKTSEITGFSHWLDGRIKTIHPEIHKLILRGEIEILVVNLIPPSVDIDVGGIAMIKSGIKNFRNVTVVVNPERYGILVEELRRGGVSQRTKMEFALEACEYVVSYESEILRRIRKEYETENRIEAR
ncbi:MAG: hypothetical protein ACXQS7_01790 [Candidatus Syntropharchaeia archaeon]